MDIELDPDKEITNPTFNEGDGFAICHKLQGYGANGFGDQALMLKSLGESEQRELNKALRQVQVTLSMEEFLQKFFGLYYSDSRVLAKILGYEIEGENEEAVKEYTSYIDEKVQAIQLLKADSFNGEEDFLSLTSEQQEQVTALQVKFEKGLLSVNTEGASGLQKATVNSDNANSTNGEKENMSEMTKIIEDQNAKMAEMQKSLDAIVEENKALKQERAEEEKDALLRKADDLEFLGEGKAEFVAMLKSNDTDVILGVMAQMQKAQEALVNANEKIAALEKEKEEQDPMFKSMSEGGEGGAPVDRVARLAAKIKSEQSK